MKQLSLKRHKGRTSAIPLPIFQKRKKGVIGLLAATSGRLTKLQMSSIILSLKRKLPSKGVKLVQKVFPSYPVTAKPAEVRMGKGKGTIDHRIARIRINQSLIELILEQNIDTNAMIHILKQTSRKFPVLSRIILY